jgi:hypothetical protein
MGQQPPAESSSPHLVAVEVTSVGPGGGGGVARRRATLSIAVIAVLAAVAAAWLVVGHVHSDPVSARRPVGHVAGRLRLVPDAIGHGCVATGSGRGRPAAPLGWPCAKLPTLAEHRI